MPVAFNVMQRSRPVRYLYTAWFQDQLAQPADQDREWPACFVVEADTAEEARRCGNHLSLSFSRRRVTEKFLRSSVEVVSQNLGALPLVLDGQEVSDEEVGW